MKTFENIKINVNRKKTFFDYDKHFMVPKKRTFYISILWKRGEMHSAFDTNEVFIFKTKYI